MSDMNKVIEAKSDQLNSDDLIGGGIIVKITKVKVNHGDDQPVTINYEGDNGKPWRPCKTMSRLLVNVWGAESVKYVGRSLRLYRDPSVSFGGMAVGGIRISHMSGIDKAVAVALTATRGGKKKMVKVEPLTDQAPPAEAKADPVKSNDPDVAIDDIKTDLEDAATLEALQSAFKKHQKDIAIYSKSAPEGYAEIIGVKDRRKDEITNPAPIETEGEQPDGLPDF